ncbi:MAG: hypothetical protein L6461_18950 [Anaerolineae bacterium]|nr:hypothetical protein [Anaerolineae bacterium]
MKVLMKGCITIFAVILIAVFVLFIMYGIDIIAANNTVNQFMSAMDNRDIEKAYSLFATRAQKNFPIAEFKKALADENFEVYTGYEKIDCLMVQFDTGNPGTPPVPGSYPQSMETKPSDTFNLPLGKTIAIHGVIHYKDGYNDKIAGLSAFLEQENSDWRILHIYPLISGNSGCKK